MRLANRCLLAGVLIAATGSAAAVDFTFEVPLRVENAPSLTDVTVACYVSRVSRGEPYPAGPGNVVGRGSTRVTITGGRYDGVVTVPVDATGIIPPQDARSYGCSMSALGTARTGSTYAAQPGNFGDVYRTATGHTLDRLTVHADADLP